ncbi:MAG: ABC transporter permease [Acidimicrobiales bacterium]
MATLAGTVGRRERSSERPSPRRRSRFLTPAAVVGLALVIPFCIVSLFADRIAPGDPFDTSAGPALSPPSAQHLMGTDNLGRDLATGIVHGAQTSMTVILWVLTISALIGIVAGSIAGYYGGAVDVLIMRTADLFQVVPRFFLALLVIAYFGPGIDKLILLLGLTSWPFLARVVRAEALTLRRREFVEAARATGASGARVLVRQVIPNLLPVAVVVLTLFASRIILIEAGLAFLGLSDQNRISWGTLANNAQQFLQLAWWMAVFPGLAIALTVLGLNLVGDSVNDALEHQRP